MNRGVFALVVRMMFAVSALAQDRVKFPVSVSAEALGYGHLWAPWRQGG